MWDTNLDSLSYFFKASRHILWEKQALLTPVLVVFNRRSCLPIPSSNDKNRPTLVSGPNIPTEVISNCLLDNWGLDRRHSAVFLSRDDFCVQTHVLFLDQMGRIQYRNLQQHQRTDLYCWCN